MNILFNCLLWLLGMTMLDDEIVKVEQDIQERGKCRSIQADKNVVKITFMNEEDAELFASDLKKFIELK